MTVYRTMCRAKLHRLTVTETHVHYEGSLTLDEKLLQAADILPGEQVQVVNVSNGARFDTYVLSGKVGSGVVCLNGGAARLGEAGDLLIVIAYARVDEKEARSVKPRVVMVDAKNRVRRR